MKSIRITAVLEEDTFGPYVAPPVGDILLGRAATSGLFLGEQWVPRVLATLVPTERCWLLVDGSSARMRVENAWTKRVVPTGSIVALPTGLTDLRWPSLVDHVRVTLDVGGKVDARMQSLRPERDGSGGARMDMPMTVWAQDERPGRDLLSTAERSMMAELFRHLLDGTPRPRNLVTAAAARLGVSAEVLKKRAFRVRQRLNEDRFQKLSDMDELGEYLVRAHAVALDDLDFSDAHSARWR